MPEGSEIEEAASFIDDMVPFQYDFIVDRVRPKTAEGKKERKEMVEAIQSSGVIVAAHSWGHKLYIDTDSQYLQFSLGSGAYWCCVPIWKTKYYPYSKLSNLIFLQKNEEDPRNSLALILVDVVQSKNQVDVKVSNVPFSTEPGLGPCVLTEPTAFRENLQHVWREEAEKFKFMSVAALIANPKYFNGFGTYMITECLQRIFIRSNGRIMPQTTASDVMGDTELFSILLDAPQLLRQEIKLYNKDYDPANLGKPQLYMRRKWRYDFLQWFRQTNWKEKSVRSFCLHTPTGWRTIWTPTIPEQCYSKLFINKEGEIDEEIFYTTKTGLKLTASRPQDSKAQVILPCGEKWYHFHGFKMTKKSLGVGPHEWHSGTQHEILIEKGDPVNKVEKGPEFTPRVNEKQRPSKRKRNGHRLAQKKRKIFQSTQLLNMK